MSGNDRTMKKTEQKRESAGEGRGVIGRVLGKNF
jgi:hypothetical protein